MENVRIAIPVVEILGRFINVSFHAMVMPRGGFHEEETTALMTVSL